MFKDKLDELEVMVLQKRLEVLQAQGIIGRLPFELGENFLALMDDKWIFDGIVSTIHGMQEMYDPSRDDIVGATLPPRKKKRGRKSKKELAQLDAEFDGDDFDFC